MTHENIENGIQAAVHKTQTHNQRTNNLINDTEMWVIRVYKNKNMEGQPADEECKNNRENDPATSLFSWLLQAPSTNNYGHIRDTYYQEWDQEAHNKSKYVKTPFSFNCNGFRRITTDYLPPIRPNLSKMCIWSAADPSSNPDDNAYDLGFANGTLVLCPHHQPD
ncbi:putative cytochrome P450 303a1 [Dissostichus eleginoides]|uniref:Cytochrome P450 303a1 n=1 Tax=Dissostichus eleginoides TaxID=100907 RepID=A0AAD9C7D4_DISEL|nr:putative cytochrome P450 303a1 [Dissostichus eleginoides]